VHKETLRVNKAQPKYLPHGVLLHTENFGERHHSTGHLMGLLWDSRIGCTWGVSSALTLLLHCL